MESLIKRLRRAEGSPILKTVLLGPFDAERTCLSAAAALERMQWNTDMEAAPEYEAVLVRKGDILYPTTASKNESEGEWNWSLESQGTLSLDDYVYPEEWMHLPE